MPSELSSSQLYNFNLALTNARGSRPVDLSDFTHKLVTSLWTSITSEDQLQGKKSRPITEVVVYVFFDKSGKPCTATFLKRNATKNCKEYVAKSVNGATHLVGIPALTKVQEDKLFTALIKETRLASPFDELGEIGVSIHNAVAELEPSLKLKKKKIVRRKSK